jgi:hypothetical protein
MNEYVQAEKVESKSNPLRLLWSFFIDHWSILLFGILAALAFLYSDRFAEFFYGLLRFIIVIVASMALRDIWFKKTVRPYINQEGFMKDFATLPEQQKVWLCVIIMLGLLFASVACFIHP